jgi:predicted ATP-grasp superfamily ATP-dependent carboligase
MSKDTIGAIVLGGHIQAYGIVRILGESSISSVVIDSTKFCIARHSKYCQSFYIADLKETIGLLKSFIANGEYKNWMIIPTDDYQVRELCTNKESLSEHFIIAVDDWDKVSLFFNKCLSYPLAAECKIPIPITMYPSTSVLGADILDNTSFPCIIKPAVMRDFYSIYRTKAVVCKDRDALIKNYQEIIERIPPSQLMVQEIIPGGSENQYSVGVFFDGLEAKNTLIARRRRQHPLDFGNATTYAESVDIPLLMDYAMKILTKSGYKGVCEVEFKRDLRDGEYKFLEVNPRLWKWHLLALQLDIPLLLNYRQFLYCNSLMPISKVSNGAWRDILTDIPVCMQLWLKGLYNPAEKLPTIAAVWNSTDPKPFMMQIAYLPHLLKSRR